METQSTLTRFSEPTFLDLFSGIGGFRIAAERMGLRCVGFSEISEDAISVYKRNFNTVGEIELGDATKINVSDVPNFDLLFAGFPCQPFSIAGKRLGFEDTRGTLFYEIVRILRAKRPRAFLLENVGELENHKRGQTLATMLNLLGQRINNTVPFKVAKESLGYYVFHRRLDARDFGVPQLRDRLFIVGFDRNVKFAFPNPMGMKVRFAQVKDQRTDLDLHKLPKTPSRIRMTKGEHIIGDDDLAWAITTKVDRFRSSGLVPYRGWYRYLTELEMARLQGFPDSFQVPFIKDRAAKLFGNSVCVNVVEAVLREMLKVW